MPAPMIGHFITKCQVCGVVIAQCRCADANKAVDFEVCDACQMKAQKPKEA